MIFYTGDYSKIYKVGYRSQSWDTIRLWALRRRLKAQSSKLKAIHSFNNIRRLALLNISAEISEADLTGVTQIFADYNQLKKHIH
jgi:hypothetical protein